MKQGVLIISHGSRDSGWTALVDEAVGQLTFPFSTLVEASFLENVQGRGIQDGIDRLEAAGVTDILAIPLFVSAGSTHVDEIGYALGAKPSPEKETDLAPFRISARLHFGSPLHDDPLLAHMVWDKVKSFSENLSREVILLIGHGSRHDGFLQRWEQGFGALAERVQAISGVARADYALLNPDQVKDRASYWRDEGYRVIAVPLFLSAGYFTNVEIPKRLDGVEVIYSGDRTLLPHPLLHTWMERQVASMQEHLNSRS
ncbi:CbiX/SirB N-terminal domain-containing protein [Paenibacillus sp. Marseille-Q4541]|uniref:sirohydrochlorin chelatase n=1 Tax=Paenibacillus sp. Marseille-Q4541 TaxID=2831522 RepID=UPI001BAC1EFC|nr:CbiX/SirB N-terminal domain-containing protein [Paenibacillus sp. Marseille-Q4541]